MAKIEIDEKVLIELLKDRKNEEIIRKILGDSVKDLPDRATVGDYVKGIASNRTGIEMTILEMKMPITESLKLAGLFIFLFLTILSFLTLNPVLFLIGLVLGIPGIISIISSSKGQNVDLQNEIKEISELKKKIEAMQDELKACKK